MPTAAAAYLPLLLAPGFLMVRGYARRRYHTLPDRDIYAVAEAIVASAIWLALIWLVLLEFGNPIKDWGILPLHEDRLKEHRADVVLLGLAVVVLPYGLGALAGATADWLGVRDNLVVKGLRRLGFLRSPTAWDRAWLTFYKEQEGGGEVVVRLKDGETIRGNYASGAQVDLSPSPHQLFLTSGYAHSTEGAGPDVEERAVGSAGVFIEGSEISVIYFKETQDVQPEKADPKPAGATDRHEGPAEGETAE